MSDIDGVTFVVSNFVIFLGYCFLAAVVVPRTTARLKRTRVGGVLFFFTCGLTHIEQIVHYLYSGDVAFSEMATDWHMIVVHVVQAVAVWMFVTGLYLEMVRWGPWSAHYADADDDDETHVGHMVGVDEPEDLPGVSAKD